MAGGCSGGNLIAASSSDGSLLATSNGTATGDCRIRCYDGRTALGALRFTLVDRDRSSEQHDGNGGGWRVKRLAFVTPPLRQQQQQQQQQGERSGSRHHHVGGSSPQQQPPPEFLASCLTRPQDGDSETVTSVQIWDLNRGVVVHRIDPPSDHHAFADVAPGRGPHAGTIHVLAFASSSKKGKEGKCVVYGYDAETGKLLRKVKAGGGLSGPSGGTGRLATSPDGEKMAVQVGTKVRLMDVATGSRLQRFATAGGDDNNSDSGEGILAFSSDSKHVLTSGTLGGTTSGEHLVHVYTVADGKEGGGKAKSKSKQSHHGHHQPIPVQSCLVDSAPVHVQTMSGGGSGAVAVTCASGSVSIFVCSFAGGGDAASPPVKAAGRILMNDDGTNDVTAKAKIGAIQTTFHPNFPQDKLVLVRHEQTGGVYQPIIETLTYRTKSGDILREILVRTEEDGEKKTNDGSKKRKGGAAILGPGEGGTDAHGIVDVSQQQKKKAKVAGDTDHVEDVDAPTVDFLPDGDPCEGEDVVTIADRLKAMSEELAREDEDDPDLGEENEGRVGGKLIPASDGPNTDSLDVVLTQALRSSDEGQLEVVLSTGDHSVIERTVSQLEGVDDVILLLTKLIHRIAKKPNRAEWLGGVWIKTILRVHAATLLSGEDGGRGRAMVARVLGPLKNLLTERTESLPQLLKLEGRLSLLSSHYSYGGGGAGAGGGSNSAVVPKE